ncbi:MAG: hypothetical protein WBG32_23020, partial [Nodosilinea sp.]
MAEAESKASSPEQSSAPDSETGSPLAEVGAVSSWLTENGFDHELALKDHLGVEVITVTPQFLIPICTA